MSVNQDVNLYSALINAGEQPDMPTTRYAWLHVVKGTVEVNGELLNAGDAAAFTPEETINLTGKATGKCCCLIWPEV